ncbi:pentatricopeptide repeat-containing protein [Tanacetum coccineum]
MLFTFKRTTHLTTKVTHLISLKHISSTGLTNSILAKCPNIITKKTQPSNTNASIQQLLLNISNLNPKITRKLWRNNEIKPQDFHELLLGFESCNENLLLDGKNIESLFAIFKRVGVKHVDGSFRIMVGLLVRVGLFKDAEWVLLEMDKEGVLLDDDGIYGKMIEWYVGVDELGKCVELYDKMRGLDLVPSASCYGSLVEYLVCKGECELVLRVYDDMVRYCVVEKGVYEKVIRVLCRTGKVQESRNLIKRTFVCGLKPTSLVLDAIASGYCEKKDYDDLLSLFSEMDSVPDVAVGNKIIQSMCQNLGVEEAFEFMKKLERLRFTPDATTFGILIGWSCKEGNLKDAFCYLGDVLSRGLKPHKNSYNAIISAVFKQGMWNHAKDIVLEMEDEGVTVDMSTYRVLLAGYCKSRQFDEVKMTIEKMVNKSLIELSPLQDPIAKAFLLLGIDPLAVRVRRDNDVAFSRTEFYDSMGNGLYLEGNVVDFDQTMVNVLDDSMIPDYNRLIVNESGLATIAELVHWGQEVYLSTFSALVKKLHVSNSGFKTITTLLEHMPHFHNELDEETLNLLVQAHVKRGFVDKAKKVYNEMIKKNLKIKNKTYSAIATGVCKKGNSKDLHECWDLVQNKNWLPTQSDYRILMYALCQNDMVMEVLSLFERAIVDYPHESLEIFYGFLEKLCGIGLTKVARVLLEEFLERGYDLDQVAYSHILHGLCEEKRFSEAFVMSKTMLAKNIAPDFDIYNVLLHGYCMAKDLIKVKEVLGAILKKNITISISSYSKLVSLMCNGGRSQFALSIKDHMVKQNSSHIIMYNMLIFHLFASRNNLLVDMLLCEIQEKGLEFNDVTYNFLVHGFSQCVPVSRTLGYLTEMMSRERKPSNRSLRAVIRSLLNAGEFNKVLKLSQQMQTRGWVHCSTFQNEVVMGFLKTGKLQEAINFLDKMAIKDLVPDNINYDIIIKQMCCNGRKDKAFDLLDTMLKKGNIPDSTSYDCLVQDLCVSHRLEEALDLYTEMLIRKLKPDIKTYEIATQKLCESGRTSEAEKIIYDMICVGEQPSEVMFRSVISRHRSERNYGKASELLQMMQQFGYKPDFETHWSLISTLSRFSGRDKDYSSSNFLSRLLSESGFMPKKGVDPKLK